MGDRVEKPECQAPDNRPDWVLTPVRTLAIFPCMVTAKFDTTETFIPLSIRLPRELHARLFAEAERRSSVVRKVSIAEVLRDLIDKGC